MIRDCSALLGEQMRKQGLTVHAWMWRRTFPNRFMATQPGCGRLS